jgi:hypothetical protein
MPVLRWGRRVGISTGFVVKVGIVHRQKVALEWGAGYIGGMKGKIMFSGAVLLLYSLAYLCLRVDPESIPEEHDPKAEFVETTKRNGVVQSKRAITGAELNQRTKRAAKSDRIFGWVLVAAGTGLLIFTVVHWPYMDHA